MTLLRGPGKINRRQKSRAIGYPNRAHRAAAWLNVIYTPDDFDDHHGHPSPAPFLSRPSDEQYRDMSVVADSLPIPPSPDEEDISRASAWEEEASGGSSRRGVRRGKEKESDQETLHDDDGDEPLEETYTGADEYPPTKEEEAESRRIEENLRKWEIAERERRKAARESAASGSGTTSLVGDFTRRASLLWPSGRAKQASLGGVGAHRALRTADDAVPLDDIEGSPAISPSPSPEPPENPFTTPGGSTISLNDPHNPAIMTASTSTNPFEQEDELSPTTPTAKRPTLHPSASGSNPPPPPEPLGLPRPRTPPPRTETPHANRPPEPVAPPTIAPQQDEAEALKPTPWWTEWLCGCSEGPDRGGDHQAGRTNPFE